MILENGMRRMLHAVLGLLLVLSMNMYYRIKDDYENE
jgi:hypothetical protein